MVRRIVAAQTRGLLVSSYLWLVPGTRMAAEGSSACVSSFPGDLCMAFAKVALISVLDRCILSFGIPSALDAVPSGPEVVIHVVS